VKERLLTTPDAPARLLDQRPGERVEPVECGVVGVQRDQHRVVLTHHVRILGQRPRAECHVADRAAREERTGAGGDLDDPV
jgi:hypothetical protein